MLDRHYGGSSCKGRVCLIHRQTTTICVCKVHVVVLLLLVGMLVNSSHGFLVDNNVRCSSSSSYIKAQSTQPFLSERPHRCLTKTTCFSNSDDSIDGGGNDDQDFPGDFPPDFGGDDLDSVGVVIEDLNWRVEKLRLEEANTRRFLKAKPIFLPYKDACDWVQAWGRRWQNAEDWNNWIADGEKRNSYIPSRPEEYYSRKGEWISWNHFLGIEEESSDGEKDAAN